MSVVPHSFLFRYSFPVRHVAGLPGKGKRLLNLPADCILPDLNELDAGTSFAELRIAWNEQGLGLSVDVSGKTGPPKCNVRQAAESDGLQVWIDTRNTQSIHRASRFCHHFCLLPGGAGKKSERPAAVHLPIARARDEMEPADTSKILLSVAERSGGYRLEAWLPGELLTGYDPDANPRLGFYYCVRDTELGEQYLNVGRDFPFAHDPSLWSTLELVQKK